MATCTGTSKRIFNLSRKIVRNLKPKDFFLLKKYMSFLTIFLDEGLFILFNVKPPLLVLFTLVAEEKLLGRSIEARPAASAAKHRVPKTYASSKGIHKK